MTTMPPYPPRTAGAGMVQPHRGALLLTFGILSLVMMVLGVFAAAAGAASQGGGGGP